MKLLLHSRLKCGLFAQRRKCRAAHPANGDSAAANALALRVPQQGPEFATGPKCSSPCVLTRQQLGWNPAGPDLLTDLRNMDYGVA